MLARVFEDAVSNILHLHGCHTLPMNNPALPGLFVLSLSLAFQTLFQFIIRGTYNFLSRFFNGNECNRVRKHSLSLSIKFWSPLQANSHFTAKVLHSRTDVWPSLEGAFSFQKPLRFGKTRVFTVVCPRCARHPALSPEATWVAVLLWRSGHWSGSPGLRLQWPSPSSILFALYRRTYLHHGSTK